MTTEQSEDSSTHQSETDPNAIQVNVDNKVSQFDNDSNTENAMDSFTKQDKLTDDKMEATDDVKVDDAEDSVKEKDTAEISMDSNNTEVS